MAGSNVRKAGGCTMNGNGLGYLDATGKVVGAHPGKLTPMIEDISNLKNPGFVNPPLYSNPGPSGKANFHPRSTR